MTYPKNWEIFTLNELVDVLDNQRVPVNSSERSKRLGPIPYYGATGQVGTIDKAIFNEDLLILGEDGVQFFDPNKPKAYKISGPSWVNNHAHVLRARKDKVLQNYLLHFLNQFNYVGYANGTTRLKLTQGAMNSIPVPLPSIDEQHKIVELLEEHLSRLDAALADVTKAKLKAAQFRRSLLQSVFTGHLSFNGTSFVNLTSRNWEFKPLGKLVDAIRNQSRIEEEKIYELWSIPSFSDGKPECVVGKSIGSSKLIVEPNDILISKINPRINRVWKVGESHLEQLASPEWLVARIKDPNQLDGDFLRYYLSSPEFRDWISQAASSVTGSHSRAKASEILHRDIPLPSLSEQQRIVELLEDHISHLDASLAIADAMEKQSASLRRSLLQAAFTGQLTKEVASV